MRICNGHRFEISIFNPRDDRAGWYRGSAEVPHGPVIPRVENADLKSMPIIDSFSFLFLFPPPFTHNLNAFLQFIERSIVFQTASITPNFFGYGYQAFVQTLLCDTK